MRKLTAEEIKANEKYFVTATKWINGGAKMVKFVEIDPYDGYENIYFADIIKACKSYVKCAAADGGELRIRYNKIVDYIW